MIIDAQNGQIGFGAPTRVDSRAVEGERVRKLNTVNRCGTGDTHVLCSKANSTFRRLKEVIRQYFTAAIAPYVLGTRGLASRPEPYVGRSVRAVGVA